MIFLFIFAHAGSTLTPARIEWSVCVYANRGKPNTVYECWYFRMWKVILMISP